MKTIAFAALVSFLTVSGLALAAQSGDQKEQPTTPSKPMMQEEMMKDGKEEEHMDGMLRMMKMMEQCSRMMESGQSDIPAIQKRSECRESQWSGGVHLGPALPLRDDMAIWIGSLFIAAMILAALAFYTLKANFSHEEQTPVLFRSAQTS